MKLPPGFRDRISDVSEYAYASVIIILSIIAMAIFLWLMYDSRGTATAAESGALMNALLISDTIAFAVAAAAVTLCLYLSSVYSGDFRGQVKLEMFALFFIVMVAPIVFIGADILLNPWPLEQYGANIALVLSLVSMVFGALFTIVLIMLLRPRQRIRALVERILEEYRNAGSYSSADAVASMPQMTGPSLSLISLLKKLSANGDPGPAMFAIDCIARTALESSRSQELKSLAAAGGMVGHIVDVGAIGAQAGNNAVVCRAIERLRDIAVRANVDQVSTAAFRGIGYACNECMKHPGNFRTGTFDPWLAGIYASIYDATGKRESLDRAVAAVERALTDRSALTSEELARALYASGQVCRRLADADRSEEKAMLAISQLAEARGSGSVGPMESMFTDIEIGRAYAALASMKNPIKSYKKALSQYEEAGKALGRDVSRYDTALLESLQGHAHAMLADEYNKARRFDDALDSARSAIERYKSASGFFTPEESPVEHGKIMSDAGLAHTLISEIYTHMRELDGALKHASMAIDCYSSALEVIDKGRTPEGYASLKVSIGVAQMGLAEICFKEKRYDEAITACDRAIACYNEALRIFESRGREKQAAPARKHLKEANDLFNTFMMIGSGKGSRQLELGEAT